jgi:enoyl-CoA hydratase/carnithine racemase
VDLKATRFEVDDVGVATIWLHRPHRHNAWTGRMHAEYRHLMATLEADPQVRAVVVTGTPQAFCVGGDSDALAGHAERGAYDAGVPLDVAKPGYDVRPEWDHDFAWHYGLRLPVIAAVNGACAGVALALVCFCDLRVVSAPAKITTAAPKLGLPAEYGLSYTLPRLIGLSRATDLLLTGRVVTGAESAHWGLWNEVARDGKTALAAARALARHLASAVAPTSIAATKRQIYADLTRDVGASLTDAAALLGSMTANADYREGVAALREKRAPKFPGPNLP